MKVHNGKRKAPHLVGVLYHILLAIGELLKTVPLCALILTESLIAMNALKHAPLQHPFAIDICRQVYITPINICIARVSRHSTFTGNIWANCAAKETTSITPVPELHTSPLNTRSQSSALVSYNWGGKRRLRNPASTSRRTVVMICCVYTGHTRLTHYFNFQEYKSTIVSCL